MTKASRKVKTYFGAGPFSAPAAPWTPGVFSLVDDAPAAMPALSLVVLPVVAAELGFTSLPAEEPDVTPVCA
jgi:hypothetical protein